MPTTDTYSGIAERYDAMLKDNPSRETFFRKTFDRFHVKDILDCACGTGKDLLLFHSMGYQVFGSDLSDSMLNVAQKAINEHEAHIPLLKGDFHNLREIYNRQFGAVVCLSNSINEIEVNAIQALESMRDVLGPKGIVIFDQGQTDFTMADPPLYAPIVNTVNLSRLYTMHYEQDIMDVDIFDFIHDGNINKYDFSHNHFKIRIRLYADWKAILERCHLKAEYHGSWAGEQYSREKSTRLIVVATKA